jgi:hypothetical protein
MACLISSEETPALIEEVKERLTGALQRYS